MNLLSVNLIRRWQQYKYILKTSKNNRVTQRIYIVSLNKNRPENYAD